MPTTEERRKKKTEAQRKRRAAKKAAEQAWEQAKKEHRRTYWREWKRNKRAKEKLEKMSADEPKTLQTEQALVTDSSSSFSSITAMSPAAEVFKIMMEKKEASLKRTFVESKDFREKLNQNVEARASEEERFREEVHRQGEELIGLLSTPNPKKPASL